MKDDIEHIAAMGRRCGKTTVICEAAKKINATVLVRDAHEAKRVNFEHGVKAVSVFGNLRGSAGPFLVDTDALSMYAYEKNRVIYGIQVELTKALEQVKVLREALETAWDRLAAMADCTENIGMPSKVELIRMCREPLPEIEQALARCDEMAENK